MMRRQLCFKFLILLVFNLWAVQCSSIVNLRIETNQDEAEIYLNGEPIGKGKVVEYPLEKAIKDSAKLPRAPQQLIKVSMKGYADKMAVLKPNKKYAFSLVNIIGPTVGWGLLGGGIGLLAKDGLQGLAIGGGTGLILGLLTSTGDYYFEPKTGNTILMKFHFLDHYTLHFKILDVRDGTIVASANQQIKDSSEYKKAVDEMLPKLLKKLNGKNEKVAIIFEKFTNGEKPADQKQSEKAADKENRAEEEKSAEEDSLDYEESGTQIDPFFVNKLLIYLEEILLDRTHNLTLIERESINRILKEQQLSSTALFSETSNLQLGKMLFATKLLLIRVLDEKK